MTSMNCSCRPNCVWLTLLAGILIGIAALVLRLTAVITVTPAFLWAVLGVAVVYLPVALAIAGRGGRCLCNVAGVLVAGLLGTLFFGLLLLAVPFAATSVLGAIFTGLLLFFLTLPFGAIACAILCAACE